MITLGNEPTAVTLKATKGQGLDEFLEVPENDEFPDGTTVKLEVNDRRDLVTLGVWPAVEVLSGGARIVVDADDMDALPNFARVRVYVTYPGNQPLCWYDGTLIRRV